MNYNIQLTKIANSSILIVMGMTGAGTIKRFHGQQQHSNGK